MRKLLLILTLGMLYTGCHKDDEYWDCSSVIKVEGDNVVQIFTRKGDGAESRTFILGKAGEEYTPLNCEDFKY